MVEVMGGELDRAFERLGIPAEKVVETQENQYQVWAMTEEAFETLSSVPDKDWEDDFGWWRSGSCILEGSASEEYTVNGEKMLGYKEDDGALWRDIDYSSFTEWMHGAMNLSTCLNIVIMANSLARDNGMTLSEFISKYEK